MNYGEFLSMSYEQEYWGTYDASIDYLEAPIGIHDSKVVNMAIRDNAIIYGCTDLVKTILLNNLFVSLAAVYDNLSLRIVLFDGSGDISKRYVRNGKILHPQLNPLDTSDFKRVVSEMKEVIKHLKGSTDIEDVYLLVFNKVQPFLDNADILDILNNGPAVRMHSVVLGRPYELTDIIPYCSSAVLTSMPKEIYNNELKGIPYIDFQEKYKMAVYAEKDIDNSWKTSTIDVLKVLCVDHHAILKMMSENALLK